MKIHGSRNAVEFTDKEIVFLLDSAYRRLYALRKHDSLGNELEQPLLDKLERFLADNPEFI
jgi:hypothetical protein